MSVAEGREQYARERGSLRNKEREQLRRTGSLADGRELAKAERGSRGTESRNDD